MGNNPDAASNKEDDKTTASAILDNLEKDSGNNLDAASNKEDDKTVPTP